MSESSSEPGVGGPIVFSSQLASNGPEGTPVFTRKDWVLLALDVAGGEPVQPVQLQKALFVLGAELRDEVGQDFYQFVPHNYGPFSRDVYEDAERLALEGLASKVVRPGRSWSEFAITLSGSQRARLLRGAVSERAIGYLEATMTWARSLSFPALVASIYQKYPEMRENSIFVGPR